MISIKNMETASVGVGNQLYKKCWSESTYVCVKLKFMLNKGIVQVN